MTGKTARLGLLLLLLISLTHWLTITQAQTPEERALAKIEAAAADRATTLDLSKMGIYELPPEIGQLTGLVTLQLRGNFLEGLPDEIGQLTGLVTLDLRGNSLTELPEEVGQLINLEEL